MGMVDLQIIEEIDGAARSPALRRAYGRFPSGVVAVCALHDGARQPAASRRPWRGVVDVGLAVEHLAHPRPLLRCERPRLHPLGVRLRCRPRRAGLTLLCR